MERRFTEEEQARILREAVELQLRLNPTEGATLGDIERAAQEAGIDPVYIRMAAVNVPSERQESPSTADSATLSTAALYLLFHIGTVASLTILIRQQVWLMLPCWALCVFLGGLASLGRRQARLVGAAILFHRFLASPLRGSL